MAKQLVALKPFYIIKFQYIHYVEYSADSGEYSYSMESEQIYL